ncbi:hypothetical protein KIH23_11850 [Flavobacterium sp. CYK-55]|uniref:hypothetical protein n=1 Tax=Flavobacterium sp. CYK-55 TaxID=2835529 RepID=UPI001BCC16A5|nr:hypothetical protein [Flavobacterium sp. CYK-55]MBS7787991.1 hypothetical protein [Flavobacterium sp. CYK-55]
MAEPFCENLKPNFFTYFVAYSIDSDIINSNATLYKGQYAFNPNVGQYGGYILKIKITK